MPLRRAEVAGDTSSFSRSLLRVSAEVPSGGEWCVQAPGNHQLFSEEKDSFISKRYILTPPHSHADEAACVATLTSRIEKGLIAFGRHGYRYRCGTPSEINPRTATSYHGWRRASAEHSASCPCREWTIEDTMRKISTASSQTAVALPNRSCKAKLNANTCAVRKRRREASLAALSTCADTVGSTRHPERSIPPMAPTALCDNF